MALVGGSGIPSVTPLCHVFSKGVLYIETNVASWKVRTLTRSTQIAYVVDEYSENWYNLKGIRIHGTVEVLREGSEYRSAKRMLFRKFPQFKELWEDEVDVIMKVTPIRATSWGL